MKFHAAEFSGVYDITLTPHNDDRGFFARIFCPDEFAKAGIVFDSLQINVSRNDRKYTLRGMHWQDAPFAEAKVVRCLRGRIHDVIVDLRPDSATYRKWIARELSAQAANALFIPEGFAHGFLTLEDECDVFYQMGRMYEPGKARGFRFDDPAFGIKWPHTPAVIGKADLGWSAFTLNERHPGRQRRSGTVL